MTSKDLMPKDFFVRMQINGGNPSGAEGIATQLRKIADLVEKGKYEGKILDDQDSKKIGSFGMVTRF